MISDFKELERLFEEIDSVLQNRVHIFIIGGAVLLYHGMKRATKDIDLVVGTLKEFNALERAFQKLIFTIKIPTFEYRRMELNQIFVREDLRIDLFQRTVCEGFALSDAMKKRAKKLKELKHLAVSLCSNEDIFLLKTFTEREGDIDDCIALAQAGIEWSAVLKELKSQIRNSRRKVWVTWVGERLDILQERGLAIPIMNEVDKLREKYFDEREKRQSSGR